jgi:hypothetical protein
MDGPHTPIPFPLEIWNIILASTMLELPDYKNVDDTSREKIKPPASFIASRSSLRGSNQLAGKSIAYHMQTSHRSTHSVTP